ncbi:MAG: glycosyltransferase family 4 protein [bacterium]|nr:glycosyltransferase family 4 protein [bacterium]
MRVLLTSPVFPPDLGGPAVYVPSFARFMRDRGHEVKVVAFCSEEPQGYPYPVIAIPRGPLPVRYLKAFWAVLREAKGCDVVYVNEHLALLHVLAARLRRVPTVIRIMVDGSWEIAHRKGWCPESVDIVTFQTESYGLKVRLTRFLQRRWWKWCRHIVCCSEFLRQILIQHHGVPAGKTQRILNAYHGPRASELTATKAEARARLGLDGEKQYVLTICRLMVWKRVDRILEALQGLAPDVHLVVAGDGDMLEPWRAFAAKLGMSDRVTFLGNVPHAEIPLYIRAADVFVLNSEYEGLSHTLLEVQVLGTPTIASGVCGNPEVVEHGVNGLLVDPQDRAALREAIRTLLEEPELGERFVNEGIARAGRFDRELTFTQVEAVLLQAAGIESRLAPV